MMPVHLVERQTVSVVGKEDKNSIHVQFTHEFVVKFRLNPPKINGWPEVDVEGALRRGRGHHDRLVVVVNSIHLG